MLSYSSSSNLIKKSQCILASYHKQSININDNACLLHLLCQLNVLLPVLCNSMHFLLLLPLLFLHRHLLPLRLLRYCHHLLSVMFSNFPLGMLHRFDDTYCYSPLHITYCEPTQWSELRKCFNAQRLCWYQCSEAHIPCLDELRVVFKHLSVRTIHSLLKFGDLACYVSRMTVKDWSVSHEYLPRMIHDDELGIKRLGSCGFVLSCLTSNITSMKILYCYILDVDCGIEETRGVYWLG